MIESMTLKEMETYAGKRAKPEDFDLFWEEEIKALPQESAYKREKKEYGIDFVECFDLTFKTLNGSTVYAKYLKPIGEEKLPVMFHFHGYQGRTDDWSEYFKFILAGYAVVAMDVRGQAGLSIDNGQYSGVTVKGQIVRGMTEGPQKLFFKEIYLDVYQLIEIVSCFTEIDETRMITYGASQGGALAFVGGALNKKIAQVISIYPFLSDFERVFDLKLTCEPYDELYRYFKYVDPICRTKERIFSTLDYIDIKNFSSIMTAEVKMVTGLRDDICAPSTQFAAFNQLGKKKEHIILPEYGHEALNVFINDLVMNWITGGKIGEQ